MGLEVNRVTVLGAGYMGSAITFPISDNNIMVNLWGTWLDDDIVSLCKEGVPHPKLRRRLNKNVLLFNSDEIKEALNNTNVIIFAVSSEGFVPVYEKVIDLIRDDIPLMALTKGFVIYEERVLRISEYAELRYKKRFGKDYNLVWGSVGGPVKAVELSRKVPTATIIGSKYNRVHDIFSLFETEYYRVSHTNDIVGLELCSALKNVFAIAGGICDGVYENSNPDEYHNFKSALFMESVKEMAYICDLISGIRETAYGLAGIGDLYVTVASGRNSIYGKRIGRGEDCDLAYNAMLKEDKLAEGYNTLRLAYDFFSGNGIDIKEEMQLFDTLFRIIFVDKKYNGQLEELIKIINI